MKNPLAKNRVARDLFLWVLMSVLLFLFSLQLGVIDAKRQFENEANAAFNDLAQKIKINEVVLSGMVSTIKLMDDFSFKQARQYTQHMLKLYPHIHSIQVLQEVPYAKLNTFLSYARQTNELKKIEIQPAPAAGADTDEVHYPVIFLSPLDESGKEVLGQDLGVHPELSNAFARTIAKGTAVAILPTALKSDGTGYVLFERVKKEHSELAYIVGLVIHVSDLLPLPANRVKDATVAIYQYEAEPHIGEFLQVQSQQHDRLTKWLFPLLIQETSVESRGQRYELFISRQLGWQVVNPWLASTLVLMATLFSIGLAYYTRIHAESEKRRSIAEMGLKDTAEQLRTVTDSLPVLIAFIDSDFVYRFNNKAYEDWYGRPLAKITGHSVRELVGENGYAAILPFMQQCLEGRDVTFEQSIRYENNVTRMVRATFVPRYSAENKIVGFFALVADISSEKRTADIESRMGRILDNSSNEIYIFDAESLLFVQVNYGAQKNLGYSEEELHAMTPSDIKPDFTLEQFNKLVQPLRDGTQEFLTFETTHQRKDGSIYPVEVRLQLSQSEQTPVFVAVIQDISERKKAQEKLIFLANFDELTALPNRTLFRDRLHHALAMSRHHQTTGALLFFDLDDFKKINDTLGHNVGDSLLRAAAIRMQNALRQSDTVSRLGGDEFTVILEEIQESHDAANIAEKILQELTRPFEIDGHIVYTSASIGITLFPNDGDDVDELIKNADTAMYRAKESGAGRYQFFTPDMNKKIFMRLMVENQLRQAIEKKEFEVYYQPQLTIQDNKLIGLEALIRWNSPTQGLILPDHFIPVAEETGLITHIGHWTIQHVFEQIKQWEKRYPSLPRVSINVSARQFREPNFITSVKDLLIQTGLSGDKIELELTESILIENLRDNVGRLNSLRDLGIHLAVDDFGTGYSSLNYLKKFPVDTLKIDRSFVRDIHTNQKDQAIVSAIIEMANIMKLRVIAEGIENEAQAHFFRSKRCDGVQGFLIAKPQPSGAIERWLQT